MMRTFVSTLAVAAVALAVFFASAGFASAWWPNFGYGMPGGSIGDPYNPSLYGYPFDDRSAGYYGGGRYTEYYNYGRGYGIANYPGSLLGPGLPPDYRGDVRRHAYHSAPAGQPAPAPIMQGANVAQIMVEVPTADAEVWIEDQKTQQAGKSRWFASPPLEKNQVYEYKVRVRWTEEGKQVEQAQKVTVQAGDRANLAFPTGGKKEIVTTPRTFPLETGN